MTDLTDRLANLSPAKRRLLELRLKETHQATSEPVNIPKRSQMESIPLSFGQLRQWFLQQLEPNNTGYNKSEALTLTGPLNVAALHRAIDALVKRHEILRTTYHHVSEEPLQVVNAPRSTILSLIDLRGLSANEQQRTIQDYIAQERAKPFDLSQDLMFRHTLFRIANERHVFFRVMHHIASDKWSVGVLNRELSALYAAFHAGHRPRLPKLAIQYADFAIWQRNWLQGERLETELDYWRTTLENVPVTHNLSLDFPRPHIKSHNGAIHTVVLSPNQTTAFKKFSQQQGVTLFMTLLAAFKVFLHRYTHQIDIVVGGPIAGRTLAETEGLIGLFINTLVFRTDLSGNPPFLTVLDRVRQTALEAYAHQDLPFEKLVEVLQPERIPGQTPIFQIMFDYLNTPTSPLSLANVTSSRFLRKEETSIYDLTLLVSETANGELNIGFEYSTDLFAAATITQMQTHFQTILKAILDAPHQPIGELPLLTNEECHQILLGQNQTQTDYPSNGCLHQLIENQAAETPNSIALEWDGEIYTFDQLNTLANQLAHLLGDKQVVPGDIVAICLEPTPLLIIGLLAVLKAGACYLPLDSSYPETRLAYMLADSQTSTCLTTSHLREVVPLFSGQVIYLDEIESALADYPKAPPALTIDSTADAYLIYTSGSTGKPKGVQIQHQAVVNFVQWAKTAYGLCAADRVLQFASISFDTAIEEIFPTLAAGATLVIPAEHLAGSFQGFVAEIQRLAITVLDLPTAFWHNWVSHLARRPSASLPSSLRLVIVGGEKALLEDYQQWQKLTPSHIRWVNTYGPTEATVVALAYEPAPDLDTSGWQAIPIGQPIANVQAYILDSHLNPVPNGVTGELFLAGPGLAKGYVNNPDLTRQKFIEVAFAVPTVDRAGSSIEGSIEVSSRLYRTGDLVRRRADGQIDYMGRQDRQVKLRGYRIELGEIEAAIRQENGVQDVIVTAREIDAGDRQLVAYVVPADTAKIDSDRLRLHLNQTLPSYMLPAHILILAEVPLTGNGKVDLQALPDPVSQEVGHERAFTPPKTDIEVRLVDMWAALLKIDHIGIDDSFFALGGHSLMATQLVSRLREAFDIELPLRTLFDKPTISDLALIIEDLVLFEIENLRSEAIAPTSS